MQDILHMLQRRVPYKYGTVPLTELAKLNFDKVLSQSHIKCRNARPKINPRPKFKGKKPNQINVTFYNHITGFSQPLGFLFLFFTSNYL
jgi:hypothetical protein